MLLRMLLAALLLPLSVTAAGPAPVREPVAEGETARWRLDLKFDKPMATAGTLWLTAVGDKVTSAWSADPILKPKDKAFNTLLIDPAGLKAAADGITGTMTVRLRVEENVYTAPRAVTVAVSAAGGATPAGRLEGTVRALTLKGGEDAPLTATVTGGRRWAEAELRSADGVAAGLSWPGWLGPNQNFSATRAAARVVPDIAAARLVWKSEYVGPPEMGSYRYGLCGGRLPAEGGASPVVAGGRVFVFRVVPAGEVYSRPHVEAGLKDPKYADQRAKLAAIGLDEASLRATWAIDADEQVLALDAATGRTLWKTTFPRAGLHMHDHKCGLTNHTGCATAERVYVFGSLGVVRCLSAADGSVLWETPVPGYHQTQAALKAKCLKAERADVPTRSFCHALNLAEPEGVLLAPAAPGDGGIVGLSAADGKVLWTVKERILSGAATPLIWRGGGKALALSVANDHTSGAGTLTAVDVRTGAVAWTAQGLGSNPYQPVLDGDVLILNDTVVTKASGGADVVQKTGRMAGWKVSATGLAKLWTAPDGSGMTWYRATAAVDGGVASIRHLRTVRLIETATGKTLAADELPEGRDDETHTSAMNGVFFPEMDTQHGKNGFYTRPLDGKLSALWRPPHPHATTYHVPMSHAWVDGRLFLRGRDGVYCYDLRAAGSAAKEP